MDRKFSIAVPELDTQDGKAHLEFSTYANGNGSIVSSVQLFYHTPNRSKSCVIFQDYSANVRRTKARATQKNIDREHSAAFPPASVEAQRAAALAHYPERRAAA